MRDEDKQIEYLIDFVTNNTPYGSEEKSHLCEELLRLSLKREHLYGQAMAHIQFAGLYQGLQEHGQYTAHIERAYKIAAEERYLDILVRYYNLEGIRYMQNYDDINALSMYLKGIYLTTEASDHFLHAVLYNNIAEIFFGNYDYDKAVVYYLKALKTLDAVTDRDPIQYRKMFTENLISSYCFQKDLENAKKYLDICKHIPCDDGIRPFAQEEAELRVLMLEQRHETVLPHAMSLFRQVKASPLEDTLLFYTYSFLCDIFLDFKRKDDAFFCLSRLEQMKMELSQNHVLETQKRKLRYDKIFALVNDGAYKEFYTLTLQFERNNRNAVSSSLSASVSLYETEKEQRLMEKEREDLEEFIMYDPLTGIYNRRAYDQIAAECLQRDDVNEIACIMIDIDYFKEYNDHYGHYKGDLVLKAVSTLIQKLLPTQAYLARFGGDEFACLLVNESSQRVEYFMKNVHDRLEDKKIEHVASKNGAHLTLSLGAYYTPKNEYIDMDTLIQKADIALYRVKNSGRNGYRFFHER